MDASRYAIDVIESLDSASDEAGVLTVELEKSILAAINEKGQKGVDETIRLLNENGHALKQVARDGELTEYSELLSDGERVFQIRASVSDEFSYVDVRFDVNDTGGDGADDAAAEALRRAFYERYLDIVSHVDPDKIDEFAEDARDIYTVGLLDGEVNNGGFSQYFWNTEGQFAAHTLEVLKRIGAKETASLLRRAMKIYGAPSSGDVEEWYDRLEKVEAEHADALEDLDEQFYEVLDDLPVLVMNHLQAKAPA
ncbi:MAG: DMP19 family protein [Gammaproteobacteria bacterium]|nr:DMP19 family protein [Gammaproteobacteria bacterium]